MKLRKATIEIISPNPEEVQACAISMLEVLSRRPALRIDLSITPWEDDEDASKERPPKEGSKA